MQISVGTSQNSFEGIERRSRREGGEDEGDTFVVFEKDIIRTLTPLLLSTHKKAKTKSLSTAATTFLGS